MVNKILFIKVLGAFCVMTGCGGAGLAVGTAWKKRCEQLEMMAQSIRLLYGEMRYTGAELSEIFERIACRTEAPFSDFYQCVSDKMRQMENRALYDIWQMAVQQYLKDTCLKKEDQRLFLTLGSQLGYLDLEMQLSSITLCLKQTEAQMARIRQCLAEKQKLSMTLGLLAGFFLMIVLI